MGLFYLLSRFTMMGLGTFYPIFLSYKAIKSNDLVQLETLLMYWVVMGTVSAAEATIEWVVSWIPFYYEIKTLVIVWLTLPQIQGSTWVYVTYLHPFLLEHEQDIDATLARVKAKLRAAGMGYVKAGVDKLKEVVMGSVIAQQQMNVDGQRQLHQAEVSRDDDIPEHPPPTTPASPAPPAGYAVQLLRQYGPAAFAATSMLLRPMEGRGSAVSASTPHAAAADDEDAGSSTPTTTRRSPPTQAQVSEFVTREMLRRRRTDASSSSGSTPPEEGGGRGFEEIRHDEASETETDHAGGRRTPENTLAGWWQKKP